MTEFRSGIERRLDAMGRVVIPAEIRDALGLAAGDAVDISIREGAVVLAPVGERCPRCGFIRTDDRASLHAVRMTTATIPETNGHGS
jgi:AbrB family looped-hinge helix DNA binding protein